MGTARFDDSRDCRTEPAEVNRWPAWLRRREGEKRPQDGEALWRAVTASLCGEELAIAGASPDERRLIDACLARREALDEPLRDFLRRALLRQDPADADFAAGKLWEWLAVPEEAKQAYDACLKVSPSHGKANNQAGLMLLDAECFDEAIVRFGRAIVSEPDHAPFHNNLGIALWQAGEIDDALNCFRRAWELEKSNHEIRRNLFKAAMELDLEDLAGEVVEAALAEARNEAGAPAASFDKLGVGAADPIWPQAAQATLVLRSGDLDRAEALYRDLMDKSPEIALTGLGLASFGRDEFDAAAGYFREVSERFAGNPTGPYHLAMATASRGDASGALALVDEALAMAPNDPRFLFMRATLCLRLGRWQEGWRDYEARLRMGEIMAQWAGFDPEARWQGEPVRGKTIAVVGEQGAGDQIQFVRFAALLAEAGAEVVVYCDRALKALFERAPGVSKTCTVGDAVVSYDFWAPMLSLPGLFEVTDAWSPARVPYLVADSAREAHWRERMAQAKVLRVGLVWAGNPNYGRKAGGIDRRRSLLLKALAPLWRVEDTHFYSLQKGPPREQIADFGLPIADESDAWQDYADTAAFIAALDLVISVDTSVAHLAGALGKPVWILSRFDACWRWLENREDSPWYPTARLFGQGPSEGWAPVVERVATALADAAARKGREAGQT